MSCVIFLAKGNGYYIPKPNSQGLNVKISLQTSRDQRGRARETSARYATAWLDHGVNPLDVTYEYAIVVNKTANFAQVKESTALFLFVVL